jgi:prepilin-type N-terminal cleavage/methylation domain-containing protein
MRGFTLIELAIVLFIITLLLGGVMTPLGEQITERQSAETRRALESARIALVGYALRQTNQAGPLPCPDVRNPDARNPNIRANDGLEDRLDNGKCAALTGNLPWKTLGLAEGDAWGNRLGYGVTADWANSAGLAAANKSAATTLLQICPDKTCAQPMPAAAVVFSHGRNGFGGVNVNGGHNLAPTSADEAENSDADQRFVMHAPRAADRPGGEFDDLLLPLSPDWLRGRLCDPASRCANDT